MLDKVKELLGDSAKVQTDVITGEPSFIGFGNTLRETRGGAVGVYRQYRVRESSEGVRVKDMQERVEESMTLTEFEERFA
jgi:hypothetical protein